MSEAKKRLTWIQDRIKSGMTVYIGTHLRAVKITPRTFKKWEESEHELFSISKSRATGKDELWMARGKNWDNIMFCNISARS